MNARSLTFILEQMAIVTDKKLQLKVHYKNNYLDKGVAGYISSSFQKYRNYLVSTLIWKTFLDPVVG